MARKCATLITLNVSRSGCARKGLALLMRQKGHALLGRVERFGKSDDLTLRVTRIKDALRATVL
jgi:hypothetical protein